MFNQRFTSLLAFGLLSLGAAPVAAMGHEAAAVQAAGFDLVAFNRALDDLAAVKDGDFKAWGEKRAAVLAFGADALASLEAEAADANWTREGFRRALAAEACRLRISKPELAAGVDKPRGIDPEVYRQFRHGKPSCHRDFAHASKEIVPLLLETLLFTLNGQQFSEGEAGKLERETLVIALVQVPGEKFDSRARFVLEDVFKSAGHADSLRAFAAVSYAQCAGVDALPVLQAALDNPDGFLKVREGAALALGWIADARALAVIKAGLSSEGLRADDETGKSLRRALFVALGTLGNSGGWISRGESKAALAREMRSGCASALVQGLRSFPADAEWIRDALCAVAWKDSLKEVRQLAEDSTASQAQRKAASEVLPLLEMAVAREK